MNMTFSVEAYIARPAAEVYEAVADPDILSRYFTTGGAKGRLEAGATAWWDFADFPGPFPVEVIEAEPRRRIVFRWASSEDVPPGNTAGKTTVTFDFTALEDGRTHVAVSETGWSESEAGLKASYDNCYGWTQMLCALKAYLEHGINLREGMFV